MSVQVPFLSPPFADIALAIMHLCSRSLSSMSPCLRPMQPSCLHIPHGCRGAVGSSSAAGIERAISYSVNLLILTGSPAMPQGRASVMFSSRWKSREHIRAPCVGLCRIQTSAPCHHRNTAFALNAVFAQSRGAW